MQYWRSSISVATAIVCFAFPAAGYATPFLDINTYGAVCDDKTDDTHAFQKAVNDAANEGLPLHVHGRCRVSALTVPSSTATFILEGNNATLTFTNGGIILSAAPSDTRFTPYIIRNLHFRSLHSYADTAITVIGAFKGLIDNINVDQFRNGVVLVATSDNMVRNSFFKAFGDSNAIVISGSLKPDKEVGAYASNNTVVDVTDIYGTGVFIGPGVQGTKIRNLRVLEAWYGIYAVNGKGDEDLSVSDSYLEGKKAGLFADGLDLVRVNNCSADLPSSGADPNWAAYHMDHMFGGILANSNVWGAAAAHSSVIVAGGNINVTGNQITGSTQGPCMRLTPPAEPDAPPLLVSNNTCWASGGYEVTRPGTILGSNNLWSRAGDRHPMVKDFNLP